MQAKVKRLHYILTGLTLVLTAVSLSRLTLATLGYLRPHDFLRWIDFAGMIPLPLATVVLCFLLLKNVRGNGRFHGGRIMLWIELVFVAGVALYAVGVGDHGVTSYFQGRFCANPATGSRLCDAIIYHADSFSRVLSYAGLVLITGAILWTESRRPRMAPIHKHDLLLILMNAGLIGAGIFANLAFVAAAPELIALGVLTAGSMAALLTARVWVGRLPVAIYFSTAYGVGLVATLAYKLVAR